MSGGTVTWAENSMFRMLLNPGLQIQTRCTNYYTMKVYDKIGTKRKEVKNDWTVREVGNMPTLCSLINMFKRQPTKPHCA